MPGTIQVTVWMGKRQYQTRDKGDFSFPLTKIGENLVVALLDAGGNEIAHQEIGTMQIVEKGYWDEVFSINGDGHVHLKLQFALTEDDRNRIRIMREFAMMKKLKTNSNIKPRLAIASESDSKGTSTKNEQKVSEIDVVEAYEAGSATSSTVSLPTKLGGSILQSAITNAISVVSKLQDNYPIQKPQNQPPSNVRKMISAFENTQLQEVKSLRKASSVPSELNWLRKGGLSENQESKTERSLRDFKDETISKRVGIVSSGHESSQAPKKSSSANDLSRQHASGTATSSGRLPEEEKTRVTQPHELKISSTESSLGEGRGIRGNGTGLRSSTMSMAKNPGPKTLQYHKEECSSSQSSGMWIFPDNTRRLCITTAGEQVRRMVGDHHNEAKTRVKKNSLESQVLEQNVMHEIELKKEKNQKTIVQQPESEYGTSPDGSSNGLVGQVIKIVVIIGFGVLVLLTRQKEPRKKHREENDNLFLVPEYVDDRKLKPWTVKQ